MSPVDEINDRLRYLAQLEAGELDNVLHYTRLRRAAWMFEHTPLPLKIALYELPVAMMMLAAFPPPPDLPRIAIPVVMAAAYCVVLIVLSFFPPARTYPEAHWV